MKIKRIVKAVFLLALFTSTCFAAGKNVNVEFRKGHYSAQYSGIIQGYDYDTYIFQAKKDNNSRSVFRMKAQILTCSGQG